MIHSGYAMDIFTENYLKRIAHAGFDTILVYMRDANHGSNGPCDFTAIIDMAEAAGLDVYLYSSIQNKYHPSDPEAKAFYDAQYGALFRRYPKAKGLILERIINIANEEIVNAQNTIPLVREHSVLGYEPAMDYVTTVSLLEWKIRQVRSVLELDIPKYRKGIGLAAQLDQ